MCPFLCTSGFSDIRAGLGGKLEVLLPVLVAFGPGKDLGKASSYLADHGFLACAELLATVLTWRQWAGAALISIEVSKQVEPRRTEMAMSLNCQQPSTRPLVKENGSLPVDADIQSELMPHHTVSNGLESVGSIACYGMHRLAGLVINSPGDSG